MRITIMGSSDNKFSKKYAALAYDIGKALSTLGHVIVTGGYDGIMKEVCRGAKSCRTATIEGVVSPEFIDLRLNEYITKKIEKPNISARLYYMIHKSQIVVVFPGSIGTMAELWMSIYFNNVNSKRKKIFVHKDLKTELNRTLSSLVLYGNYNIDIVFFSAADDLLNKL